MLFYSFFSFIDIDNCNPRDPRNSLNLGEGGKLTSWGFCGRYGDCVDGVNAFRCNCTDGYAGQFCQSGKTTKKVFLVNLNLGYRFSFFLAFVCFKFLFLKLSAERKKLLTC